MWLEYQQLLFPKPVFPANSISWVIAVHVIMGEAQVGLQVHTPSLVRHGTVSEDDLP